MNIVFLNCTVSYGHKFVAANYKMEMLAKGLTAQGDSCALHNGFEGILDLKEKENREVEGVGKIIAFPYRGNTRLDFIRNFRRLYADLKKLKKKDEKNILILSSHFYHIYLLYELIGKLLGYQICVISHEWLPTFEGEHPLRRLSNRVYSKLFAYGVSSILPISEYIIDKIKGFGKPYLKTPVLAEFGDTPPSEKEHWGFTYCATINYRRVLDPIIESYLKYKSKSLNPQPLRLVLSGSHEKIDALRKELTKKQSDNGIEILTKLPYKELFSLYSTSSALLLPLDPESEQDKARFSQKIAEYLSTGTPIVTTSVGEIPVYFTAGKNAYITEFSINGFSEVFKRIDENPEEAEMIGLNGFELGKTEFDALRFGAKLHKFLTRI